MGDFGSTGRPALALLAGFLLALAAAPAKATSFAMPHGAQLVNVSVGFNSQLPLPDLGEETLAAAQKSGREYVYRLGREECALLEATIAETCRLTNLNVNTQIEHQYRHNTVQPHLRINGNATFSITLKDAPPAAE